MSAISTDVTVAGLRIDTRHWIGGRRVARADTFANHSPIDGSPLGEVHRGGAAEVDAAVAAAVAAAREAFPEWAAIGPQAPARLPTGWVRRLQGDRAPGRLRLRAAHRRHGSAAG